MSSLPKKRSYTLFYYILLNIFISIQEITGLHTVLTSQLQFVDLQQEIASGDVEHALIDHNHTRTHARILLGLCGLEDLQIDSLTIRAHQRSPGTGIGTQATDEVVDALHRLVPVHLAGLLEELRCIIETA